MKKVEKEDIADIACAGNLKLSPSGKTAVFAVKTPVKKDSSYTFDLYETKGKNVSRLTWNGVNDDFLFDTENVLLIKRHDEKKKDSSLFFRLRLDGGEAEPAFELKEDVQFIAKVSDGLYALLILKDWNAPGEKADEETRKEEQDYHIFEEVPFWGNGRGYISGKRRALYLYDEKKKKLKRITGKYTDARCVQVHGSRIACLCASWKDVEPLTDELHVYDIRSDQDTAVVKPGKVKIGSVAWMEDDLVFTASSMKPWGTGQLYDFFLAVKKGKKYETEMIHANSEGIAVGDTTLNDVASLGGRTFRTAGRTLYFTAMKAYHTDLYFLNEKEGVQKAVDFKGGIITGFDTVDGKKFFLSGAAPDHACAIFKASGKMVKMLHDPNASYFETHRVETPEYLSVDSPAGGKLDGWVIRPHGYKAGRKYPGILEIHGGPRCAYGITFYHEMQMFASDGYFVFFCNPHGSEGYGEEFADLRGRYGTIDYEDLMAFTDAVLKAYPDIDERRLGACGGSYGGFMCNWIEGHTDRFGAIASQRSVSNWVADFGASEIGVSFDSNEMAATPWTDMEKMWAQSPLKYADQAHTPILFIHSLCDYNCTIDQGVEFFTAMKYHHVPSRMVVFEGENHSLSRSGKPKHRIRRLKEMLDWFNEYLGGGNGKISD